MSIPAGPAAWLTLTGLVLGACGAPEPPRHVLLISIDTLRADHLGLYGYARPTSPNLDALAGESLVFNEAWATAPWTLPSHASLLTGLYPSHHGARRKREALSRRPVTLAEAFQRAGFATGAVVNTTFLGERFGLDRGFDDYRRIPEIEAPEGAAARVTERGLRWLEAQGDRRTFLFLHYFDVHSDYASMPAFTRKFAPTGGRIRGTNLELMQIRRGLLAAGPDDIRRFEALYDAGIAQLDHRLGALFDWLREAGRWDDTLLVVTSDHGEEFRDHGNILHGETHYQEMLHVPLLLRRPGAIGGRRVDDPVSLVDVAPTLLAMAGVPLPADLDGVDLSPIWHGGSSSRTGPIFAETGPQMRDALRSARDQDFKLILDRERNQRKLFDLTADPEERRDISEEHPEVVRRLQLDIEALEASALPPGQAVELSAEILERLRALGYEDGAS